MDQQGGKQEGSCCMRKAKREIHYDYWKKKETWTFQESILLSFKYEPTSIKKEDDHNYINELRNHNIDDYVALMKTKYGVPGIPKTIVNNVEIILKRINIMQGGIDAGTLKYTYNQVSNTYSFKPSDFISYASSKGIPIIEKLHPLANGPSLYKINTSTVKVVFKKTANSKWLIGLEHNEKIYDNLDGYLYINYLLGKPNESLSSTTLYDLKPKHESASNKIDHLKNESISSASIALEYSDSRTIRETNGKLRELEDEEEKLRETAYNNAEDALRLKDVSKEIEGCKDYLKKNTRLGISKVTNKVSEQCRQKVQKAIIKALNKIAKSDKETAKYLKKIDSGKDCRFNLDSTSSLIFELN
jgi:hypothetical protein